MYRAKNRPFVTPQEYLALERTAEKKSEYYNGEIFAMAGATHPHNVIVTNTVAHLNTQLRRRGCELYSNDMRVKVSPTDLYTSPDVVVVCGSPRFEDEQQDTWLNPTLLVEMLSKSTEDYDRRRKFEHYRTLESLTDYVLISQERALVEHRVHRADNRWLVSFYTGTETSVPIESLGCKLALDDIYDKIEWADEDSARGWLQAVKEPAEASHVG